MKIEELRIHQRVVINDGADWNDNQEAVVYGIDLHPTRGENITVVLTDGGRFDGFRASHLSPALNQTTNPTTSNG